ncbi:hypothetical protein GCM10007103_35000 [Salinimicrobium marinum]|uniref:Uncharacterized protein n=1 Tax=Salinimicrobium marinum TaxID=680283 RepID=A0A918SL84_9FLAO|nr:hypothetical protein [Salinimicrobium marinum]GHA51513.1 hypothetical protein GCM10007103_35000 [Salinimicrobium marinum]
MLLNKNSGGQHAPESFFQPAFLFSKGVSIRRNDRYLKGRLQRGQLSPEYPLEDAIWFIDVLDKRCSESLPESEINKIKRDIIQKLEEGDLIPIENWPRYVVFSKNVSTKERQIIGAQVAGRNKRNKTLRKIHECLDDWDLHNDGKVTNKKIAEKTGLAKKTVDKYSPKFREQKKLINENFVI